MQQLKKPMRAPRRTTLLRNDIIVNMLSESTLMNDFFRVGADQLCQRRLSKGMLFSRANGGALHGDHVFLLSQAVKMTDMSGTAGVGGRWVSD